MPGCHPSYSFPASPKPKTRRRIGKYLSGLGATGALGGTGLEAVQEAAVDNTQGAHATGAGGLAALGLLAPVDCCDKCQPEFLQCLHGMRVCVHLRVLAEG